MSCKLSLLILIIIFNFYLCEAYSDYTYYPQVNVSYKFHTTPLKWGEARLKCIEEKAVLAMPKNAAEAQVLKEIFEKYPRSSLNRKGVAYPNFFLLRFHDLFAENEYITDDGHSLQYFFNIWKTKEPNNLSNEDCGSMYQTGFLNDYPCNRLGYFVCQKDNQYYPVEMDHLHINRDPAYILGPQSNKRFKFHTNPRTWDQARIVCQSEGGQLANIESKQEEDFLVNLMNKPQNKVHYVKYKDFALLGFHDYFIEGNFVTTKGEPLHSLGYIRWQSGQPNRGSRENCGSMHSSGGLHDFPCSVAAPFICEIKNTIDDYCGSYNEPVPV